MEKIIVICPKLEFDNIRLIISGVVQCTADILLMDPKESPDYLNIIKEANVKIVCALDDSDIEDKLKKSIEESVRVFELRDGLHILDGKIAEELFDNTPWYYRFFKKGRDRNPWLDKSRFMKKRNQWRARKNPGVDKFKLKKKGNIK